MNQSEKAANQIDSCSITSDIKNEFTSDTIDIDSIEVTQLHQEEPKGDFKNKSIIFYEILPSNSDKEPGNTSSFPEMEVMIRNMSAHSKISKISTINKYLPSSKNTQSQKLDSTIASFISCQDINPKEISINRMGPREQEEADEWLRKGMNCLFDNQFMKAKSIFQSKFNSDPLYANGLGIMIFMKSIVTGDEDDIQLALDTLMTADIIASCQIGVKDAKKSYKFTDYFAALVTSNQTGLPINPSLSYKKQNTDSASDFISSGALRAYIVRAESCLLSGVLQFTREHFLGLVKCSSKLQKAYSYYTVVWQEYKRMGQKYTKYMDRDTVSAMHLGLGTLHLLVSCFPPKISKAFSLLGFKKSKGIKSSFASFILLSYYSILCTFVPQIYVKELLESALDCLNEAQRSHPNSSIFLYSAGILSRVAKNLSLSTRLFQRVSDVCLEEWVQVPIKQATLFEIGINFALQLNWEASAEHFEVLRNQGREQGLCQYFIGACQNMLGKRTESILSFAQVHEMMNSKSSLDVYVIQKVKLFEKRGYQNMEFYSPGLELLLVWNAFEQMNKDSLESCLTTVQNTLELIYEREKMEYNVRLKDIAPNLDPPDYYDQRTLLLLIKAAVFNALKRYKDSIIHINWIIDNIQNIKTEVWVIPFVYWEAGVTSWGLGDYSKSRKLWEMAMYHTKHVFEYRMMLRLSLALRKCDEIGIQAAKPKEKEVGLTSNGRRRMPIVQ
ncbi:hypothetical protein G6F37_006840 [Rhizopus arrhizus]|nr:hypothetical protein G6F38_006999 [Rhizopus arrhizus]KAG1157285.1 hypothetical protein G6F37_006840 [Rhizopus arrhizus]